MPTSAVQERAPERTTNSAKNFWKCTLQTLRLRSRPPFTGVLRGPGLKVPHGVLFEQFWAPASECPKECFLSAFWPVFWALKVPKSTQKALFGALRGRCPKLLKKHSVGHFQARAPEHSCKWRPGSQHYAHVCFRFACPHCLRVLCEGDLWEELVAVYRQSKPT